MTENNKYVVTTSNDIVYDIKDEIHTLELIIMKKINDSTWRIIIYVSMIQASVWAAFLLSYLLKV